MIAVRTGAAVAVAVAVLIAGCAAPTAPEPAPEPSPEPSSEPSPVTNESDDIGIVTASGDPVAQDRMPADPDRTFGQVQTVLGSNVDPPDRIQVREPASVSGSGSVDRLVPPFWETMGVDPAPPRRPNGSEPDLGINGYTTGIGEVALIYANDTRAERVEYVLAHEFVHFVQFSEGRATELNRQVDVDTTDGAYVTRSVLEGAAVYATDDYIDRYVEGNVSNAALYLRLRERLRPGSVGRYLNSWYIQGNRYVASRIDSPERIERVYERPPTTSEQVLHRLPPGTEPPRELSVTVTDPGAWRALGTDRVGEAFLRVTLRNRLSESRARRAAAGWGNDSLRVFRPRGGTGDASYAWVLRWDDPENATEFEAAFEDWLDASGNRTADRWTVDGTAFDLQSAGSTTSVVLVGDRRLVEGAEIDGQDGRVEIALPDATANESASVPAPVAVP